MNQVQFVCDSETEADDMVAHCLRQGLRNPVKMRLRSLQIIEVEGERPAYRFRTRIYQTSDMGGQPFLVVAERP